MKRVQNWRDYLNDDSQSYNEKIRKRKNNNNEEYDDDDKKSKRRTKRK